MVIMLVTAVISLLVIYLSTLAEVIYNNSITNVYHYYSTKTGLFY